MYGDDDSLEDTGEENNIDEGRIIKTCHPEVSCEQR